MTTSPHAHPSRRAALACVAGSAVIAAGAFLTQAAAASSDVPDDRWSYPWSGRTAAALFLLWAAAQAAMLAGLVGFPGATLAGRGRGATAGLRAAVAGTALILAGHLASIPVRDQTSDDTAPQLVGALFGLGTLLTAAGFLVLGARVLGSRTWSGWRRYTPLAVGLAAVALVPLQLTEALPSAVGVYGLSFAAFGLALALPAERPATADAPIRLA